MHLLRSPHDAWTRILRKVASDTVHRIFDSLTTEEISTKQNLTKEVFLYCFLKGKSKTRSLKGLTNRGNTHVGREIKVRNGKEEPIEKYFTSNLFQKPTPVMVQDNQCFSPQTEDENPKFLFRHNFKHESAGCVHHIDSCDTKIFLAIDKRQSLLEVKEEVVKELTNKFLSSDDKIKIAIRDVFIEHFDKTDEKIDNIGEQIAHGFEGQEEMLSRIYMRIKRLEERHNTQYSFLPSQ